MVAGGEHLADPDHGGVGPPGIGPTAGVHVGDGSDDCYDVAVAVDGPAAGQEVQPATAPRQRQNETPSGRRRRRFGGVRIVVPVGGCGGGGCGGGNLGVGRRSVGRRAARQEGTVATPLSHMQQRV